MMPGDENAAIVLIVSDGRIPASGRYFAGVKKRRVYTAWSLAGAELFGPWRLADIEKAERAIVKVGKSSVRITVGEIEIAEVQS